MPGRSNPGSEAHRTGRQVHDGAPHRTDTCRSPMDIHPPKERRFPQTFCFPARSDHRVLRSGAVRPPHGPLLSSHTRSTIPEERHGRCQSPRDRHPASGAGVWVSPGFFLLHAIAGCWGLGVSVCGSERSPRPGRGKLGYVRASLAPNHSCLELHRRSGMRKHAPSFGKWRSGRPSWTLGTVRA